MARPKKEESKKVVTEKIVTEVVKNELTTEELIANAVANAVAEAMVKKEEELTQKFQEKENEMKEQYKKDTKSSMVKRRKFVPEDTSVIIEQVISGGFTVTDLTNTYLIQMNGYGDNSPIRFKELKNFNGNKRSFLRSGAIRIIDAVSSDPEISLENVIEDLNLRNIYFNEKTVSPLDIEEFLTEEDDIAVFNEKLSSSKDVLGTITDVAITLYREGKFNDNTKMNIIRQVMGDNELFTK